MELRMVTHRQGSTVCNLKFQCMVVPIFTILLRKLSVSYRKKRVVSFSIVAEALCQKIVGSIEGTLNSPSPEGQQIKKKMYGSSL